MNASPLPFIELGWAVGSLESFFRLRMEAADKNLAFDTVKKGIHVTDGQSRETGDKLNPPPNLQENDTDYADHSFSSFFWESQTPQDTYPPCPTSLPAGLAALYVSALCPAS